MKEIHLKINIHNKRYFWKLSHSNDENIAYAILKYQRRFFLESNVGFVHEIFNICCKYQCLDVWHLKCKPKENKLATIRRIVEAYHLKKDLATSTDCLYMSILFQRNSKRSSAYKFEPFFSDMGLFPDTTTRSYFVFALLDNCKHDRICQKCREKFPDVLQHLLRDCPKTGRLRLSLTRHMKLYNVPPKVDLTNKRELFKLALYGKRVFLNVLCDTLSNIGYY